MAETAPCQTCGTPVEAGGACGRCGDGAAPAEPSALRASLAGVRMLDYRSTFNVALLLQLMLAVTAGIQIWELTQALPYRAMLEDLAVGSFPGTPGDAAAVENAYLAAAGVGLVVLVTTGVLWLGWNYRTYMNLDALARPRVYAGWWTIWGWVIPVMNLFRPRQIAGELWAASSPDITPDAPPPSPLPWYFNAWWAAWLLGGITNVATTLADGSGYAASEQSMRWSILGLVVHIAAVPPAIMVVRSISTRQELLARRIEVVLTGWRAL